MQPFSLLTNHLNIFLSFIGSRSGISVFLATGLALFLAGMLPALWTGQTTPHWTSLVGLAGAWLILTHTFGYILERARFEREHDDTLERQLTGIYQQLAQLKQSVGSTSQEPSQAVLNRLDNTNTKLNELSNQIGNTQTRFTNINGKLLSVGNQLNQTEQHLASELDSVNQQIGTVNQHTIELSRRLAELEQDISRVQQQNMDLKRKLPEVIDMVTRVSQDLAS